MQFMGVRELDFEEGMASIQLNGKRAAVYDVEANDISCCLIML